MASASVAVGLGFGDEGKGGITDFLTRKYNSNLTVRFNGGSQAGHNVVTDDGRHHCFSQWGSGTFAGARTLLSRFMMVNPIFAASEAKHLESVGIANPWPLLLVERDALITTPFLVAANRLREIARKKSTGVHGSCGMGIGETMRDFVDKKDDCIFARDLADPKTLQWKLSSVRERKLVEMGELDLLWPENAIDMEFNVLKDHSVVDDIIAIYEDFAARANIVDEAFLVRELDSDGHVIFEGAQGVLLDEWRGFHPYTTWSTCTFENADALLGPERAASSERLGILRAYHTRHGAGPFPTWSEKFDALSHDDHNKMTPWQESFRSGAFDVVLAKYALDVTGPCGLVVTHLDKFHTRPTIPRCWGYELNGDSLTSLPLGPKGDLVHQEKLAHMLLSAQPWKNENVGGSEAAVAQWVLELGEILERKVALVSEGKTASSKFDGSELAKRASPAQKFFAVGVT